VTPAGRQQYRATTNEARTESEPRSRGSRLSSVVIGLLVAGTIAGFVAAGHAAAGSEATGTLKLVVQFDRHANARDDLEPSGDSSGDQVSYTEPVFAADNRTRLGRAIFLNTFQDRQGVLVAGAVRLRNGSITLAGVHVNGAGGLAVTGGTGAYAGARGTWTESGEPIQVLGEDGPSRHRVTIRFVR